MECFPLLSVSAIQDHSGSIWASPGKSSYGGGEKKWNVVLFSVCQSSQISHGASSYKPVEDGEEKKMECRLLDLVPATQDHSGNIQASQGKSAEFETGMAEKSSPGTSQTDGKNLVWFGEIERKFAKFQYLPLLLVLPLNYFMVLSQHCWPTKQQLGEEAHQCSLLTCNSGTCTEYIYSTTNSSELVISVETMGFAMAASRNGACIT